MDWEDPKHALAKKEPRKGRRLSLAADIQTLRGLLVCYCAHLEVDDLLLSWLDSSILTSVCLPQIVEFEIDFFAHKAW